jgi:hypothetical protein
MPSAVTVAVNCSPNFLSRSRRRNLGGSGSQSGSRGRVSGHFELFSEEDDLQLKLNP